jgi:hypothetical protein
VWSEPTFARSPGSPTPRGALWGGGARPVRCATSPVAPRSDRRSITGGPVTPTRYACPGERTPAGRSGFVAEERQTPSGNQTSAHYSALASTGFFAVRGVTFSVSRRPRGPQRVVRRLTDRGRLFVIAERVQTQAIQAGALSQRVTKCAARSSRTRWSPRPARHRLTNGDCCIRPVEGGESQAEDNERSGPLSDSPGARVRGRSCTPGRRPDSGDGALTSTSCPGSRCNDVDSNNGPRLGPNQRPSSANARSGGKKDR